MVVILLTSSDLQHNVSSSNSTVLFSSENTEIHKRVNKEVKIPDGPQMVKQKKKMHSQTGAKRN